MTKGPVNMTAALRDMRLNEGTWHISKNMTKLKQAMKKPMPKGEKDFNVIAKHIGDDELWDDLEDLKKGQDMVPAIKKAMKRLGIKEEVQLDEARKLLVKDFRMVIKIAIKHINDMQSAIKDIENYKKGLSNHPDVMDILKKANEEVELTEAIDAASYAKQIAGRTARNDHFGARVILARLMKDKQLENFYNTLEKMHTTPQVSNAIGNDAITLRGKLEKVLIGRLKNRLNAADVKTLMDAL